MGTTLQVQGYKYQRGDDHRPSSVGTRKDMKIREYQRAQRWVSVVREEHREHMVLDRGACGDKCKRGN